MERRSRAVLSHPVNVLWSRVWLWFGMFTRAWRIYQHARDGHEIENMGTVRTVIRTDPRPYHHHRPPIHPPTHPPTHIPLLSPSPTMLHFISLNYVLASCDHLDGSRDAGVSPSAILNRCGARRIHVYHFLFHHSIYVFLLIFIDLVCVYDQVLPCIKCTTKAPSGASTTCM